MAPDGAWTRAPLQTAAVYRELGLVVFPECPPTCPMCEERNKGKVPWEPITGRHMSGWQQRGLAARGPDLRLADGPGPEAVGLADRGNLAWRLAAGRDGMGGQRRAARRPGQRARSERLASGWPAARVAE
jgi:hypothetical protein